MNKNNVSNMFNGSDDFSALNMQGDMSQRNTNRGQNHSQRDTEVENSNHTNILYAGIALFIIAIFSTAGFERIVILMLFSFILRQFVSDIVFREPRVQHAIDDSEPNPLDELQRQSIFRGTQIHHAIEDSERNTLDALQRQLSKKHIIQRKKRIMLIQRGDCKGDGISEVSLLDNSKAYSGAERKFVDATEQGDIANVTGLLDEAPEIVTERVTVDLVENAVDNDDYEMLCALLRHYQNLLKSNTKNTSLDSLLGSLVECVYTNKPLMTHALANVLLGSVNGSKEVIFEKLFTESISRGCYLSITHEIARLWKHSFSISDDDLAQEYIRILKNLRNDFETDCGIYTYKIIHLELMEIDKFLGIEIWNTMSISKLDKIMRHTHQGNIGTSLNRPYLNFLLSSEGKLNEYIKWHEEKHELEYCNPIDPAVATDKILQAVRKTNDPEYESITINVHKFMKKLCLKIQESELALQCIPNLVGSAREQTRNFHPDEFDYELVFQDIAKLFKVIKMGNVFFFRLLGSPNHLSQSIRNWLFEFQGKWYLNPDQFKETINKCIQAVLAKTKLCLRGPFMNVNLDSELFDDVHLSIDPFGSFTEKVKFSCITLFYFGTGHSKRKELAISIDLIPTLEADIDISIPVHKLLTHNEVVRKSHIIAYGHPIGFQLSFSQYENLIINALPSNIKKGYKIAKGVRALPTLCHASETKLDRLKNDCAAERITTFMLKTTVLFITSKGIQKDALSIRPRRWAYKIYEKLLHFLEVDKRIPNFFMNESNSKDGECLFKIEINRKYIRERECNEMIELINEILCALEAKGTESEPLPRLATAVSITKEKEAILPFIPLSLRLIDDHLWCCREGGISVYDLELNYVCDIELHGIDCVYGAVDVGDGAVIATAHGLLLISYTGEQVQMISSGSFTDVSHHAGLVYAAPYNDTAVHVYDPSLYERIRTFTACPSDGDHVHTLSVTSHGITLACIYNNCIHMLDDSGALQKTHGNHGKSVGDFFYPHICSMDNDGCMLVADQFNHRFQIFHDGEWRVLSLQPQPSRPMSAVETQHALYVVTWGQKLIMYDNNQHD